MDNENVLTTEIAEYFLNDPDSVDLTEYTELEGPAAVVLCQHNGDLDLDGLVSLSPRVASTLSRFGGGSLSLSGLQDVSEEVAEILKSALPPLSLCLDDLSPDVAEILRSHPSFRIDDSRLQNWLLEQCGFESDNEGQPWIGEDLRRALCEAADKYTCRDPDSDHRWLMLDCYTPFDEGVKIIRKAGNKEIHFVELLNDARHILVFIGAINDVQKRLTEVMARHSHG